jgi:hypothetical protein
MVLNSYERVGFGGRTRGDLVNWRGWRAGLSDDITATEMFGPKDFPIHVIGALKLHPLAYDENGL